MLEKKKLQEKLSKNIEDLNYKLSKNNILELSELLGNSKKLMIRNFVSGLSKGIGMGIGFTILTAILLIMLQKIVTLNIPVIGDYVSDIVEIVESRK